MEHKHAYNVQLRKEKIYKHMLTYPAHTTTQIAAAHGVTNKVVCKIRNEIVQNIDYNLAQKISGRFLTEYQMASDYWRMQIDRLEKLKEMKMQAVRYVRVDAPAKNNTKSTKVRVNVVDDLDDLDNISADDIAYDDTAADDEM